ncbi:MAG: ATP-binding cassette domain-containing protein [Lachnospiraceae bacterium]|nr:ATP-binding cassette domain-containing protein [Lachnospiraceae bacterium]
MSVTEKKDNIPVIHAADLRKEYLRQGKGTNIFTAVDRTELSVYAGELVVLKGRSGSGKTTLLNMLAGLLTPTDGKVLFYEDAVLHCGSDPRNENGIDLYALGDEERSLLRGRYFGYIPQGAGAVGSLTVTENVLIPWRLSGEAGHKSKDPVCPEAAGAEKEIMAYAAELLEILGIGHLSGEMPRSLSGGELRRLAIARALVTRPAVIFADEPTGDLDDQSAREVFSLLRKKADEGAAVLLVTHENGAEACADRCITRQHPVSGA